MTPEMQEKVDEARLRNLAAGVTLTPDYLDQAMANSPGFFAAYTPWGIATIEAAFLLRMESPSPWDSKDLIHRDILENPHLHTKLKERLLTHFERIDWARWYDGYYAHFILNPQLGAPQDRLRTAIQEDTYLREDMRENLLLNLQNREESAAAP